MNGLKDATTVEYIGIVGINGLVVAGILWDMLASFLIHARRPQARPRAPRQRKPAHR